MVRGLALAQGRLRSKCLPCSALVLLLPMGLLLPRIDIDQQAQRLLKYKVVRGTPGVAATSVRVIMARRIYLLLRSDPRRVLQGELLVVVRTSMNEIPVRMIMHMELSRHRRPVRIRQGDLALRYPTFVITTATIMARGRIADHLRLTPQHTHTHTRSQESPRRHRCPQIAIPNLRAEPVPVLEPRQRQLQQQQQRQFCRENR